MPGGDDNPIKWLVLNALHLKRLMAAEAVSSDKATAVDETIAQIAAKAFEAGQSAAACRCCDGDSND